MWIITPLGFFSVVCKPGDAAADTLTVRARVRADLEALREAALPGLGDIVAGRGSDYAFRATAPRAEVEAALARIVAGIDYANFKNRVAQTQGGARAALYHDVWSVLHRLQDDPAHERRPARPPRAAAPTIAKADAYGGVVFDAHGRMLLREVAGQFGGYVWSFAKGRPDPGETPEETALREVREETGYRCEIVGVLPGAFGGTTSSTAFFLMRPLGEPDDFCWETASTRWVGVDEARELIALTVPAVGRRRDLAVAEAAFAAWRQLR